MDNVVNEYTSFLYIYQIYFTIKELFNLNNWWRIQCIYRWCDHLLLL